jgi:hypothetical protein
LQASAPTVTTCGLFVCLFVLDAGDRADSDDGGEVEAEPSEGGDGSGDSSTKSSPMIKAGC